MHAPRAAAPAVVLAAALVLGGAGAAHAAPGGPGPRWVDGATTSTDLYFPNAGNGGYDVADYDLELAYDPASGRLDGTATVTLTATQDLRSLSLDLRGLTATAVSVDGKPARFAQTPPPEDGRGGELVVQAAPKLRAGTQHTVTVVYGGVPGQPLDIEGANYGWTSTADGALVANEPEGASTWYPVNDAITDKATYTFAITVPEGLTAVANGEPVGLPVTADGRTTWTWRASDPMASYLSTASIGDFVQTTSTGPGGLPVLDFVDADVTGRALEVTRASLALQPDMVAFFEGVFGPYPFTSTGSIVDDDSVGYALETQTRPVYSGYASEDTVAHELAHQWVGDSVTPDTWRDIWLNEGFATYAQWLWSASRGGPTPQEQYDAVYGIDAGDDFWSVAPGDPGAADLFDAATYDRGAAALQALRTRVGDDAFFQVLRRWTTENADGSVSTADFVALAEQVTGQDLGQFFTDWIDTPAKPSGY
ncbi:M1 family metallopeptidase [Klenkia brasiliensis]|uniref:Aminopeptidase N n=1 Tax=Klenkia brasiliensis TaxID=333142 RepID=A0A1G7SQN2_9ACTN|nr:M1 family metallopeptidase [Klenkia brasiliensis]SDG24580.1 Peptidase family M1 [Klenkia brasiliensis]